MPPKGKKPAPAPFPQGKAGGKKTVKVRWPQPHARVALTTPPNPLIEARPKNFGIGQDIQPRRNLSRMVKWPRYVRLQRQKKILNKRLKVPPPLAQFQHALDRNSSLQLAEAAPKTLTASSCGAGLQAAEQVPP